MVDLSVFTEIDGQYTTVRYTMIRGDANDKHDFVHTYMYF